MQAAAVCQQEAFIHRCRFVPCGINVFKLQLRFRLQTTRRPSPAGVQTRPQTANEVQRYISQCKTYDNILKTLNIALAHKVGGAIGWCTAGWLLRLV